MVAKTLLTLPLVVARHPTKFFSKGVIGNVKVRYDGGGIKDDRKETMNPPEEAENINPPDPRQLTTPR
ncbi:hypothetical protein PIB30_003751 [Stylosanthes scabra]|uniref:Uncharacterized protein n=1 Tax=Stylosanthes scabra TaxID=79078 RepID=A0ABU6R3F5_9FABA|nr:hypothetical protein [Stylosanthes scabra]